MAKLDFKELSEKSDLESFLLRFCDYVGVKLPENYVRNSKIVGVFLQGRLVGGYMLVSSPPFRSLLFVPDRFKSDNPTLKRDAHEMLEINGLWLSTSLKSPELQLAVWFHLVANIFRAKKNYILLLRSSQNRTMERLLNFAKPKLLYEGTPALMVGDETHERIQVSITTRWNILLFSYKYWFELKNRRTRASKFNIRFDGAEISHPEPVK